MKAKYPEVVWVVFWKGEPLKIYKVRVTKNSYVGGQSVKRYHFSPGNEAKLKRENAWMRRWLRDLLTGKAGHFEMMAVIELRMPGLFAGGKKGK